MGRNKFRPTQGPWPDDGWRGWWGEEPPFHTPPGDNRSNPRGSYPLQEGPPPEASCRAPSAALLFPCAGGISPNTVTSRYEPGGACRQSPGPAPSRANL